MSITPNFCCDETKNRGAYTRLTSIGAVDGFNLVETTSAEIKENPAQRKAHHAGNQGSENKLSRKPMRLSSDSRRPPVKVGGPRSYGWRDMPNQILTPLESLLSCFLEPPTNRRVAVGAIEGLWRGYSSVCPKGTVCRAPVAVTQAGRASSVLTLLCQESGQWKLSTGQISSKFSSRLWRGILGTFFPLLFPSALSPGTWAWPKPRIPSSGSEVLLQKFSERQSDKWEVDLLGFRKKHMLQGVSHCWGQGLGSWDEA